MRLTPCLNRLAAGRLAARQRPPHPCRMLCRADAATRSLEQAVRVLNRVIGIASSPRNRAKVDSDQKAAKPVKPKWVAFTGTGSAKVNAPAPGGLERGLADYLALPVSQYSLLDPRLVERLDEESFRVTVPLDTVTGVQVRPQVLVRVAVDAASGSVTFSSETATLGDPALDKELSLQLRATLGGVAAGDRGAFRRLTKRKPPAWAPHPQPPSDTELAAAAAAAEAEEALEVEALEAAEAVEDPLAGVEDFRPLRPEDVTASAAAIAAGSSVDGLSPAAAGSGPGSANGASASRGSGSGNGSGGGSSPQASPAAQQAAIDVDVELDGVPIASAASNPSTPSAASSSHSKGSAASDPAAERAAGSGGGGAAAEAQQPAQPAQELAARVDLRVSLNVPPVLRVVPGPLLGYAGGLVMKVALQALLPSFLQLLAQDFASWSAGDPKRGTAAGSGLIELVAAGAGGNDGDSEGDEAAAEIPADWQPCTKDGEAIAVGRSLIA